MKVVAGAGAVHRGTDSSANSAAPSSGSKPTLVTLVGASSAVSARLHIGPCGGHAGSITSTGEGLRCR